MCICIALFICLYGLLLFVDHGVLRLFSAVIAHVDFCHIPSSPFSTSLRQMKPLRQIRPSGCNSSSFKFGLNLKSQHFPEMSNGFNRSDQSRKNLAGFAPSI